MNVIGSFLVGAIGQYSLTHLAIPAGWRVALMLGFLGAFTTFSSLSWEAVHMLDDGEWARLAAYLAVSIIGGILSAKIGIRIGNAL